MSPENAIQDRYDAYDKAFNQMTPEPMPTPLTDAEQKRIAFATDIFCADELASMASFARTLERNLAIMTAGRDAAIQEASHYARAAGLAEGKLAKCREELEVINEVARVAFIATADPLMTDSLAGIGLRCKKALEQTK